MVAAMRLVATLATLGCTVLVPAAAFAQAAIAGMVTDSAGVVMAGVRVEANSPALIERSRTAVTDTTGRYYIADLRPGVYAVRFTADGWVPLERTGIELTGTFTATVDAQFLPTLQETVSVVQDSTVIDMYNPRREVTIEGEAVRTIR